MSQSHSRLRTIAKISATALALSLLPGGARAEDVYKIGMSAGLTGYAATVDRAWRDGVEVAVDALNAKGGILGRKVQVIVEDNRSEPQEAVTAYRKMISSDNVNV
jgi:branched-chain amino acid transport system substrate-binding protein